MIVKLIPSPANRNFSAVNYNTNKVDRNKGELMRIANFGPLQAFTKLRPEDYIAYLQIVTARNKNISRPQFHAVISAKNKTYDKSALTDIAVQWMKEMGYGLQPYLIIFHKDTDNNHVHIVSTRVDKEGKKISSAWEHIRSQQAMNKVLGYEYAFQYRFSTKAQFLLLLEQTGFPGKDPDEEKLNHHIRAYQEDVGRLIVLRDMFKSYKGRPDFVFLLKSKYNIDLIFHASGNQKPYGYTIIDHDAKRVLKGSEVMPLKVLMQDDGIASYDNVGSGEKPEAYNEAEITDMGTPIGAVWIADDVDDQQIHGMRRRRQKKSRTNTR